MTQALRQTAPRNYENTPALRLTFLGLGVMGWPMAGHLVLGGHHVTVYNRTAQKAQDWVAAFADTGRASSAATPREAAQDADIVFCCVGNDDDVRSVALGADGAFAAMRSGAVFVDHTTASANLARELDIAARSHGLHFMDAPVSGGQAGAQNGLLTVMCGATPEVFARVQPVAQCFARAITHMGECGTGQLTKMVNQICIAGLVQALAEGVAFAQRAGLDVDKVLHVISKGAAQSWQMENRGHTMAEGRFDFGFAVDWMRKDLALVMDEARRNGAQLPVTALVDQFYGKVQQLGGHRWDTSSLIALLR